MLHIKLGLMDTTRTVGPDKLASAVAALNTQITRDLPQFWNVSANVEYLPDPERIPQGVWPIQLVNQLSSRESGLHLTRDNQPYAKVVVSPNRDDWTIDASHEAIEMLIDPSGNRLHSANAIKLSNRKVVDDNGKFEYLIEACDPCQACSYDIAGVLVSDFITPHYFEPYLLPGVRYSFTGAVTAPRQVLRGGYLTWVDPRSRQIKQLVYFTKPEIKSLGRARGLSLRIFVDSNTRHLRTPPTQSSPHRRAERLNQAALDAAARTLVKEYV